MKKIIIIIMCLFSAGCDWKSWWFSDVANAQANAANSKFNAQQITQLKRIADSLEVIAKER